jgi:L-rhamnose mutarotase
VSEYVGHVWRVRPGQGEAYRTRHARIWPELEKVLHEAGVTTYTIYQWGEVLFSHMEVDDFDRMVERFNGDPVAQSWEAEMADLIEYPDPDPNGWPTRLLEVWCLPAPEGPGPGTSR